MHDESLQSHWALQVGKEDPAHALFAVDTADAHIDSSQAAHDL